MTYKNISGGDYIRVALKGLKIMSFLIFVMTSLGCNAQVSNSLAKTEKAVLGLNSMSHPSLMITSRGVKEIRKNLDNAPLFVATMEAVIAEVDAEIEYGVEVPIPKDMSGGYTHERHKKNFFILQKAGYLFQITGDEKYAQYIKDNFFAYAEMFPNLPKHPTDRSYATGKIFWQCLNDANWLVYCSQAYDCIYEWLSGEDRMILEKQLFRPLADFISVENPQFYNRIHNHSTWGNAAVGMIGLVMDDKELINRALYGLENDGLDASMVDNDGGYLKKEGVRKAGFLAQLDYSFSPDGHFTEGPYYLRYAMSPFLLFAKSLANTKPELNIYAYRDSILQKAVYSLLYETDAQGRFFPINDSQKGMSWLSREVVGAVDIAYSDFGLDPMLLSIAEIQGRVQLDETGYTVARDLAKGLAQPFAHKPISYSDGADGKSGGISILRNDGIDNNEICLLMKYAAQGMGHGHFDRLSYSLYGEDTEIIQDYGAARWVNIDQKGGGRYLPENNTFAKQTIAHNTIVIDEQSQYEGSVKLGEENHPELFFEDFNQPEIQIVSAKDLHAYPGSELHRTQILLKDDAFPNPLVIDIMRVNGESPKQYDLPTWFVGHLLSTSFEYETAMTSLNTVGGGNGYEHIWKEASAKVDSTFAQMTWFGSDNFYTISFVTGENDEIILGRAGANDRNFNLRHDPVMIHRKNNQTSGLYVSTIESHGTYSTITEIPVTPFSSIENVSVLLDNSDYTVVQIADQNADKWVVAIANQEASDIVSHTLDIRGSKLTWKGPYKILKRK